MNVDDRCWVCGALHGQPHKEECVSGARLASSTARMKQHYIGRIEHLLARLERAEEALRTTCEWVREHLDAMPDAAEEWTDDDEQIVSSLRFIVTGDPACTEEADYTPDRWQALMVIREVLAGEENER